MASLTLKSWIARSRPRSCPSPSTVYQKIWPRAVASGAMYGLTPGGRSVSASRQPFGHAVAREVELDIVVEDHADHREVELAAGPHRLHARQPLQVPRQGAGNLVFDFLGALAHPVGEDDDLVLGQVGDGVDRRVDHGIEAPNDDAQADQDDEKAVADGEFDDLFDHSGACADCEAAERPEAVSPRRAWEQGNQGLAEFADRVVVDGAYRRPVGLRGGRPAWPN